jgi:TolA-binding protein
LSRSGVVPVRGRKKVAIRFDVSGSKSAEKSDDDDDMADDTDGKAETVASADPAREKQAAGKLKLAKQLKAAGKHASARERLQQIVKGFEGTEAAAEAQKLLDELGEE